MCTEYATFWGFFGKKNVSVYKMDVCCHLGCQIYGGGKSSILSTFFVKMYTHDRAKARLQVAACTVLTLNVFGLHTGSHDMQGAFVHHTAKLQLKIEASSSVHLTSSVEGSR